MHANSEHIFKTPKDLRRLCLSLFWLTIPYVSAGCTSSQTAQVDRLIIGEVMQKSELNENLRALCQPGGRLAGTDNGFAAEHFVFDKARQYGLHNAHFEAFQMPCWRGIETRVTRLDAASSVCDGAVALCNSTSTPPEGITAEVIDAHDGKLEDFAALADTLRGRFVLVRDGGERRSEKMARASSTGLPAWLWSAQRTTPPSSARLIARRARNRRWSSVTLMVRRSPQPWTRARRYG